MPALTLENDGYYSVKNQPGVAPAKMRLIANSGQPTRFPISLDLIGSGEEQPRTIILSTEQAKQLAELLASHFGQKLINA